MPEGLDLAEAKTRAVARALVTEPDVVLADEPTGSLGSDTGAQVLQLIREAADTFDAAVVVVTHDLAAIATADRHASLRDGHLVEPVPV